MATTRETPIVRREAPIVRREEWTAFRYHDTEVWVKTVTAKMLVMTRQAGIYAVPGDRIIRLRGAAIMVLNDDEFRAIFADWRSDPEEVALTEKIMHFHWRTEVWQRHGSLTVRAVRLDPTNRVVMASLEDDPARASSPPTFWPVDVSSGLEVQRERAHYRRVIQADETE